jgi:hypothetical protein
MGSSVELRCPTCVAVLARIRRARLSVGRPFEECPKCRSYVSRPSTKEWDLLGPLEKAYWLADRVAPYLLVGLVPALAYWALAFRSGDGELRVLLGLLALGPILVAFFPLPGALQAIRRSRARMADPMYRARLVDFERRTP